MTPPAPAPAPAIKEEYVRFFLPSVGLLGLYAGGIAGLFLFPKLTASEDARLLFLFAAGCAMLLGGAVLFAAQIWLWPVGRAVTINRMLKAWALTFPLCWGIVLLCGEHEFLAGFLQNIALWTAGLASAVIDERLAQRK